MRNIWVLPIRLYRGAAQLTGFQRTCLFHESCSAYVERMTLEEGIVKGLGSARWRLAVCRPGYRLQVDDHSWTLVLSDGTHVAPALVSASVASEAAWMLAATKIEIC